MIFKIFWRLHLELIAKYGEPLTSLEKLKNKTSKSFWSHCGVYIGSGLGGSTCDFWIIGPKGSKLVVLILTLILAWMKDGYFDRNIPHYHLCSKSLAAIYNFTITKTLEFSVPGLKIKWGLSFHYILYCWIIRYFKICLNDSTIHWPLQMAKLSS